MFSKTNKRPSFFSLEKCPPGLFEDGSSGSAPSFSGPCGGCWHGRPMKKRRPFGDFHGSSKGLAGTSKTTTLIKKPKKQRKQHFDTQRKQHVLLVCVLLEDLVKRRCRGSFLWESFRRDFRLDPGKRWELIKGNELKSKDFNRLAK